MMEHTHSSSYLVLAQIIIRLKVILSPSLSISCYSKPVPKHHAA